MDAMTTLDRVALAIERVLKGAHGNEAPVRIVTEAHERLLTALNRLKTATGGVPPDVAAELRAIAALLGTAAERYPSPYPATARKRMGVEDFLAHALAEVEKAAKETPERAVRRLRALSRAVAAAKQAFVDHESEDVEVEVFEEETTAAEDETEKEISPVAAEPALGNSAFAVNAEELHKKLTRLREEWSALRGDAKRPAEKVAKADETVWPADLNTPEFREGVRKGQAGATWGVDPAGVRHPEA